MQNEQLFLFDDFIVSDNTESEYTKKTVKPIYEPKNKKPHILELCENHKFIELKRSIENSNIDNDIKDFLLLAATRHYKFNYELIADYYSHSSKEVQELFEQSALVIIDFNKAIEFGYVKLSENIKESFCNEYE